MKHDETMVLLLLGAILAVIFLYVGTHEWADRTGWRKSARFYIVIAFIGLCAFAFYAAVISPSDGQCRYVGRVERGDC